MLNHKLHCPLRVTASREAVHKHSAALVPVLGAVPLQLHARRLDATQQLADGRPRPDRRRAGARALGAEHGLPHEALPRGACRGGCRASAPQAQ
eukprot:CAMPEP_0198568680 /NCGR_PEP_ID=MMETSP1462-20131121/106797_1 /TAXON_ID=1333877 /ORGANISM="Brandtodinium nutriculum, Strain RCC3387" /LENGTH=93 /DNA_ID=CAMNT_0044299751 /DNA_START=393 /DNA_END=671 /DNA_ORIENTATION=+